jgi:acyl dehydratase
MKNNIKLGQKVQINKSFSEEEVFLYIKISGDTNAIHHDIEYAKTTIFKNRIVPGLQVASLFGGLLGSKLPGEGTIYLGQTLSFKKPIYLDEEILAIIEVVNIRSDKPILTFKTTCYNSNNELAIDGEAIVKIF